ncbi:MAG TPA: HAD family hydrolase [Phycisphaerales bacterium]|nr:HAD family hydrolase [Phycisphaerales bacterium]
MRKYDVLVVDLDGTLLGSDGSVSVRNIKAMQKARDAGMEVIVATGRTWAECGEAIRATQMPANGLVICAGGSLMCEAGTGRTIERKAMQSDVVREVVSMLVDDAHRALVLKDRHAVGYDYLLVGSADLDAASKWWFKKMPVEVRTVGSIEEDEHPEDSIRAGAVACRSRLSPLAGRMKELMSDRAAMQHWSAVTESEAVGATTHLLEVFHKDVNKWTMVSAWCGRSGIDTLRVAAIGDGLNDVELVANAGLGIAMGNSIDEVRRVAKKTVADHDADGAAEAIERIVLGEW